MNASAAAILAAHQREEAARRLREEEEEMTPYTPQDLGEDWEFKILRSATGAGFKDPVKLRQCLEEERQAGWVLVEKFDDARIRLKRPSSARERDGKLKIDPYRTVVGEAEAAANTAAALKLVLMVLAIMVAIGVFGAMIVGTITALASAFR